MDDFWRYGVHENLKEIEVLTTYAHEQGLVDRKLEIGELFPPSVYEISPGVTPLRSGRPMRKNRVTKGFL